MSVLAVVAVVMLMVVCIVVRMLNLVSPYRPPTVYVRDNNSSFARCLLDSCPVLTEPYSPPWLWGRSGHLQTVVYAKLGRTRVLCPRGERHTTVLSDGATLTFDVYLPTAQHICGDQWWVLVCPGFGSSSESSYVRALVTEAQSCGYHLAVLNHLGCVYGQHLTAPRIFTYGGWEELHMMRKEVERLHPGCRLLLVGLSMGANIVIRYLGQHRHHCHNVWGAVSVCQGYDITLANQLMNSWENLRRAYLYTMTGNQRRLIQRHGNNLLSKENCHRFGLHLPNIHSATTLEELDRHFTCKLTGYDDVAEFYKEHSCCNYINNIDIPLILLNSEDDPIVPSALLKYAREYSDTREHAAFITTKHGGHLGFFERGLVFPHPVSWMDRFVCQLLTAVIGYSLQTQKTVSPSTPTSER